MQFQPKYDITYQPTYSSTHIMPISNLTLITGTLCGGTLHNATLIIQSPNRKKAIRILNFKNWRFRGSAQLFLKSKVLPLHKQIQLNSAKTLWKAAHGFLCPTLISLFPKRNPISFHMPFKRLDVSQNSIFYSGVCDWNSIPAKIRSCSSINSFKIEYKKYLLNTIPTP